MNYDPLTDSSYLIRCLLVEGNIDYEFLKVKYNEFLLSCKEGRSLLYISCMLSQ